MDKRKSEQNFLDRVKKYPDQVVMAHKESVLQGFEYLESDEYIDDQRKFKSPILHKFASVGLKKLPGMIKIFAKNMSSMMGGIDQSFADLAPYLEELETTGQIAHSAPGLTDHYPNQGLWKELAVYAWDQWQVKIGFTELPSQLVFKGRAVLFKYALVLIQEMEKEQIDQAPELAAGGEVLRVYNSLGCAANDIARWLRAKYEIKCQSVHPLGGSVDMSPLAGKAGLGWQGHNGLLVTPDFGQRQRIAVVCIEDKLFEFTDSDQHVWIEDFCQTCRRCERSCPAGAIYSEKKPAIHNIPEIDQTRTCIDREKCFPQFNKTLGCSICLKVCPFSQGGDAYQKIRQAFDKRRT